MPSWLEDEGEEARVRRIVRDEIAGLAGKALRRTQDRNYTRSPDRNMAIDITNDEAAEFWGEVLAEYGGEGWPVPAEPVTPPPGSGA